MSGLPSPGASGAPGAPGALDELRLNTQMAFSKAYNAGFHWPSRIAHCQLNCRERIGQELPCETMGNAELAMGNVNPLT